MDMDQSIHGSVQVLDIVVRGTSNSVILFAPSMEAEAIEAHKQKNNMAKHMGLKTRYSLVKRYADGYSKLICQ